MTSGRMIFLREEGFACPTWIKAIIGVKSSMSIVFFEVHIAEFRCAPPCGMPGSSRVSATMSLTSPTTSALTRSTSHCVLCLSFRVEHETDCILMNVGHIIC